MGNLEGILRDFFLTHRIKAQKFRGKFRSIFRKKIRSSKKSFVRNSLCKRATLRNCGENFASATFSRVWVSEPENFPKFHYPALLSLVCSKTQRKTSKTPRISLTLRTPKNPWKISRKHPKRSRKLLARKTPRKQNHQGKEGQGM